MNKKYLLISFLSLCFSLSYSQTKKDSIINTIKTATDLKSGNSQDVLASFFQLALKDINSGGRFQFNSSLIAFRAKANQNLLVDTNYLKATFSRNLNFGIDAGLDQNHQFKDAALNIKYALVNNRDKTIFYAAGRYPDFISKYRSLIPVIQDSIYTYISSHRGDSTIIAGYMYGTVKFNDTRLPESFKTYFTKLIKSYPIYKNVSIPNFFSSVETFSDSLINNFGKKALWTLGGSYSTSKKLSIQTEFLKGFVNPKKNMSLELDVVGGFSSNDTLINATTVNRQLVTGSLGLNWIIAKNSANQSIAEFKASAAYKYVASGLVANEENNVLTANGTLRVRITSSLWIPIDIKYDPKSGKVFGFINITTNFDSIRKLL